MPRSSRFVLPLLAVLGCAHPPVAATRQPLRATALPRAALHIESEAESIKAICMLLDDQVAAWNRGDLVGYMDGYWRSPQLTFFGGGSVTTGWEETLARYHRRYQAEGKQMGTLTFSNLQIELLGREAAFARGRWSLHFNRPASAGPSDLSGLFTVLLRHLPEGWRIIHDHSCTD